MKQYDGKTMNLGNSYKASTDNINVLNKWSNMLLLLLLLLFVCLFVFSFF